MTLALAALNALPEARAADELRACCGSSAWVRGMLDRRPFRDRDTLMRDANAVWNALTESDWLEAFAAHPRIGAPATGWSAGEQSVAARAAESTKQELAFLQREYEAKFGHIFIICATSRSAEDILDAARKRMANDPHTEVRVAAEEQRQITRLRLAKLIPE
jgi:OHCU decarboxylase